MDKFYRLFNKTIKHELISGSFVIFFGFIITSFISFVFNLFLARTLSYSDYGNYASLLSIFTLATIPAASLSVIIVKFAATYHANGELDKLAVFYKKNLMVWGAISGAIFLIYIAISHTISSFLKISDMTSIELIGGATALTYLTVPNSAFLQAMSRFKSISVLSVSGAATRMISGYFFVTSNLRVVGATTAVFLNPVVSFFMGVYALRSILRHKAQSSVTLHTKEIIKYGIPASGAILFLSSFVSSDVILVKHFFSTTEAGYYGGLSLIGKVIFYFTGPIPMVMFPLLVKRDAKGENIRNLLYLSIILVLMSSLVITAFYFIFPDLTVQIFLGGKEYLKISGLLGIFGVFLTIYSLNNILINFFLSVKKTLVVYLVGVSAIMQIILITLNHNNFEQVILSSITSSILLFIILLLYYMKVYGLHNSSK